MKMAEMKIAEIDDKLNAATINDDINNLKQERNIPRGKIDSYYLNKAKGTQIRSRARWVEEGEKNTKFFLNLEKRCQTNNTISTIKDNRGVNVYSNAEILENSTKYYSKLYGPTNISKASIAKYLNSVDVHHTLSDAESELCERAITANECKESLGKMNLNTSPGLDGLTMEFYVCFWSDLKEVLIYSYNEAFHYGELAESHNVSIMSLLF